MQGSKRNVTVGWSRRLRLSSEKEKLDFFFLRKCICKDAMRPRKTAREASSRSLPVLKPQPCPHAVIGGTSQESQHVQLEI